MPALFQFLETVSQTNNVTVTCLSAIAHILISSWPYLDVLTAAELLLTVLIVGPEIPIIYSIYSVSAFSTNSITLIHF